MVHRSSYFEDHIAIPSTIVLCSSFLGSIAVINDLMINVIVAIATSSLYICGAMWHKHYIELLAYRNATDIIADIFIDEDIPYRFYVDDIRKFIYIEYETTIDGTVGATYSYDGSYKVTETYIKEEVYDGSNG